jgi:hypothetical protein
MIQRLLLLFIVCWLVACTAVQEPIDVTRVVGATAVAPLPTATTTPKPTATPTPTSPAPTATAAATATPTALPTATLVISFPVIETDAAYVISQRGDQIYSGPGFEYDTIGVLFEAETAVVTGKSEDGEWWRILCSDGTVGSCWLTASPLSTQATEFATLAEMLPDPATLPLDWEMTVMSPDGRWQASTAWTETIQEIGRPFGYATLTVSDGTTTWFPISEWRQFGSSHAIIQWSGDGRYLYYTNATDAEGCYYYISGTDLYRLDVTDGTITTILREFESLNFALSPDNTTLVYTISDQPVLVRRDLATGMEKSVALTQDDAYALKGKIYWLADGVTAVLTLIHDVCFVDETETSSLLRVHTDTLTVTALVDHDDRLLRIWDWPDPDQPQIRLSDKEGSTWWLDVTSFELRQEE